ncbi:MAG: hypothetical protein RL641_58 [Candidatus Parcubacteria bacterium]|jgi:hypothetical protein
MKTLLQIIVFLSLGAVCAQQWQVVENGLSGPVRSLMPDTTHNRLVIGGEFFYVNGNPQKSIATWDGQVLDSAGTFFCNPNFSLGMWQGNACATDCNSLKSYQNGAWTTLGSGFDGTALCYLSSGGVLYVGGGFNSINSQPSSGLAVWNGSVWQNILLPYLGGSVLDIATMNGVLYIVGQFPDSTGDTFTKVLKYGCGCSGWVDISVAIAGSSAWASSLEVYKGELYLAGSFSKANGSIGNSIARYDGVYWHDVANGINQNGSYGKVYSLHVFNDLLYVGGYFEFAGGVPASNIATWDGTTWNGFGGQFNQSIMAITHWDSTLYIGGRFTMIDTLPVNYFAKYQ